MSFQVSQIDHCSVIITDVERSRRFYGSVMGLAEINKPRGTSEVSDAENASGFGGLGTGCLCSRASRFSASRTRRATAASDR